VTYQRLAIRVRRSCRPPAGPARRKRREGRPRVSPRPPRAGGCEFQVGQGRRGPGARQSGPQGAQRPQHGQGLQLCRGRVGRERARGLYRCPSLNHVRRKAAGRRRPAGEGHDADDGTSARRWLPSARAGCAPGGVMPSRCPTHDLQRAATRAPALHRGARHNAGRQARAAAAACACVPVGAAALPKQAGRAARSRPRRAQQQGRCGGARRCGRVVDGGPSGCCGGRCRCQSNSLMPVHCKVPVQGSSSRFQCDHRRGIHRA
jgi:hypothetical protein